MANMKKNIKITDEETIDLFVPLEIKRRGGAAMIIIAKNADKEDDQKYFDEKMIRSISRAYKWKVMVDEERVSSLAEIAQKESLGASYVSKIFNLNFLSPKIVARILSGTQPRTLKLQDIVIKEMPDLWDEQERQWGF